MSDADAHDVMAVDLEDGVPTEDVPLETLRSGLESDDNRVRSHAATTAAGLATQDPSEVLDLLDVFFELLEDDQHIVVFQTVSALSLLADEKPAAFEPAVPDLVELLSYDLPMVQMLAARTLGAVAVERPEFFTDHASELVEVTAKEPSDVVEREMLENESLEVGQRQSVQHINREGRNQQILARHITANLLVDVAEHDPDAVRPHLPTVLDLLGASDGDVVLPSIRVVSAVAEDDPDAVADAVEPLIDLLEHPDETIVANAVTALGFIGDEAAVEPLRELAAAADESDEAADLRDLASETADFLASGQ